MAGVFSFKTMAAGATSAVASIPTALAAATTETWTAVAVGTAVTGIAAVVFVIGAINDRRVAALINEMDYLKARDLAHMQEADGANEERRKIQARANAMADDIKRLNAALANVNYKVDASRCPLRGGDGSVPCAVSNRVDAAPRPE